MSSTPLFLLKLEELENLINDETKNLESLPYNEICYTEFTTFTQDIENNQRKRNMLYYWKSKLIEFKHTYETDIKKLL